MDKTFWVHYVLCDDNHPKFRGEPPGVPQKMSQQLMQEIDNIKDATEKGEGTGKQQPVSKPQPKVLTPATPPVAFTTATAFGGSQEAEESFQGRYPKTFEDRSTESALEAAHAFDEGSVRAGVSGAIYGVVDAQGHPITMSDEARPPVGSQPADAISNGRRNAYTHAHTGLNYPAFAPAPWHLGRVGRLLDRHNEVLSPPHCGSGGLSCRGPPGAGA